MARIRTRSFLPVASMERAVAHFGRQTAGEVLERIGANWAPAEQELFYPDGKRVEGYKAILNPKTGQNLGIVGTGWRGLHNGLLAEGLERLASSLGQPYQMVGGDVVNGGEMVKLTAIVGEPKPIVVGDTTVRTISVWQGHGGHYPFWFQSEVKRFVCSNGMAVAIPGLSTAFSVRHSIGVADRVQWEFGRVTTHFGPAMERVEAGFKALADRSLSRPAALQFFRSYGQEALGHADAKLAQTVNDLGEIWDNPRQQLAGDTMWRAFNSVTEWTQYGGFRTRDAAILGNSVGPAAAAKRNALDFALAYAG
jgi:hypothetical protein